MDEQWSAPDRAHLKSLAQDMVYAYGWDVLDDRTLITEWLAGRDLLSPVEAPDPREDDKSADYVESHARWLLNE